MDAAANPASQDAAAAARRQLGALAAPGQRWLQAGAVLSALAGVLLLVQAWLIAWVLQQALVERIEPQTLLPWLLALGAVLAARALLAWGGRELADAGATRILTALRRRLARQLLAAGVPWLRRQRSGALSELGASHVDALQGYYAGFVPTRLEVALVPLAILLAVFTVDWVVGLILLVTMPLIPVFMMLVGWSAEAASRRQLQALARMGAHFADRLRGLGLIRLYGRGPAELARIGEAAENLRQRTLRVLRIAFLSSAVLEFFASVSVALVAVYLGFSYLGMLQLRAAPLSLQAGFFCLLLAPDFYAPLRKLAAHYHDRAAALAAAQELQAVLDIAPVADVPTPHGDAAPAIRARGLAVRYPGAAVDALQGLDLDIAPGEFVAIAAPSGGGKSTLLEALAGWLPPAAGQLELTPATRIAYAPQRPFLFHGSIADNLRLAWPQADRAALEAAAEAAQVLRFARHLPDGLDTLIGERGFGLSGGEARRVALARVYLRGGGLWLLDEPTAFLDPETEAALLAALRRLAQGRSVLVATHSPAVLAAADRVLTLPESGPRSQP